MNQTLQIQFLADRPEAVPLVARWYFDQWGYKEPNNSFEATCERLYGKLNKDCLPVPVIACHGSTVVGAAQLKVREMEIFPDREFWLGGVYVVPEARGRGIAQALIEKLSEVAASLKIEELWLQTEALDGGLYGRLGWSIVERLMSKGENVAVMVRKTGV